MVEGTGRTPDEIDAKHARPALIRRYPIPNTTYSALDESRISDTTDTTSL
jgi:hypothetical protein